MKIIFKPTLDIAKDFPPIPCKKDIPEWYKDMSIYMNGIKLSAKDFVEGDHKTAYTVKKCVPVQDFLCTGYYLRMPSDLLISNRFNNGRSTIHYYTNGDEVPSWIHYHPHEQCPITIEDENKLYLKFKFGYVIKTPPNYSCLFIQNPLNFDSKLKFFPAIVDTDTYDREIQQTFYLTKGNYDIHLQSGDPMMMVIPFKRDDWKAIVEDKLYDDYTGNAYKVLRHYLKDGYRRFFHHKKNFD